jgi:dolichyl-phosphate beta-glucosyltransferase
MLNSKPIYLSVVIPAYDEEANLGTTLQDIYTYLKDKNYNYEIIIVDDGSKDKTSEIASSLAKIFANFTLLKNPLNRGKGYSVKKGILAAQGELILFMDADNSTRIDQVEKLIIVIKDGYDVAIASRRLPGAIIETSQPLYRIILGNTYILLSKIILGTNIEDYNCGFKLFKKDIAKFLFSKLTMDDWSFDSELIFLISKFKLKIKEVPIKWQDKRTSKVKPLRDGINSFFSLLKIRLRHSRF